jgi:hypothetical protein
VTGCKQTSALPSHNVICIFPKPHRPPRRKEQSSSKRLDTLRHIHWQTAVCVIIHVLCLWAISVLQHGGGCAQEGCEPLVTLGQHVPFVATRQTAAQEPGHSARFHTVGH